jgi:hypothetical protein
VHLEEGFLEDVFGTGLVTHEAVEEAEKFGVIALDQGAQSTVIAGAISLKQGFVADPFRQSHAPYTNETGKRSPERLFTGESPRLVL